MPHTVTGVISRTKGAPVELADIVVPDPGPGEVVVDVQACGVCHTDLHYREGGINDDYPFFLGHEAAGVVYEVGPGVEEVAPGDFVVLNWRAVCGRCRACAAGKPWYCFDWTLSDAHGDVDPLAGMTMAAGDTLRVRLTRVLLGNAGDTLVLRDPAGTVVDRVSYTAAQAPVRAQTLVF